MRSKTVDPNRRSQAAQSRAMTDLSHMHPEDYKVIFEQVKKKYPLEGGRRRSFWQAKVKGALAKKHYEDYRKLYYKHLEDLENAGRGESEWLMDGDA